jgi:hypothetical protein
MFRIPFGTNWPIVEFKLAGLDPVNEAPEPPA